jgi:hypothetical protein
MILKEYKKRWPRQSRSVKKITILCRDWPPPATYRRRADWPDGAGYPRSRAWSAKLWTKCVTHGHAHGAESGAWRARAWMMRLRQRCRIVIPRFTFKDQGSRTFKYTNASTSK